MDRIKRERKRMQDKIIVTKHIGIDNTYWMCLIFGMPMLFFFGGLFSAFKSEMMYGLSKGMFWCNIFITLLYIGVKKF